MNIQVYKVKSFGKKEDFDDAEHRINSWLEEKQKTCPNFTPISIGAGMLSAAGGYGSGRIWILYRE
jgi:hypothetical protein